MFRYFAKLAFPEEKAEQTQRLKQQADETAAKAALSKADAAARAAAAAAARPGPGRPRKLNPLFAATSSSSSASSASASIPSAAESDSESASAFDVAALDSALNPYKRTKIDWFARDSIHHIISVQAKTGSSFLTVRQLHRDLPHLYKDLKRSTINA